MYYGGSNKIDMWLMSHRDYFKPEHIFIIQEELARLPEDRMGLLLSLQLKKPITILLFSIFLGGWGVDRFMLGDVGLGVAKLLTGGACGIWTVIDWFIVMGAARERNFQELMMVLGIHGR